MVDEIFNADMVPLEPKARWFVQRDGNADPARGFATKAAADAWIEAFGYKREWRAGFAFRLKGDSCEMEIVDRSGNPARPG